MQSSPSHKPFRSRVLRILTRFGTTLMAAILFPMLLLIMAWMEANTEESQGIGFSLSLWLSKHPYLFFVGIVGSLMGAVRTFYFRKKDAEKMTAFEAWADDKLARSDRYPPPIIRHQKFGAGDERASEN